MTYPTLALLVLFALVAPRLPWASWIVGAIGAAVRVFGR